MIFSTQLIHARKMINLLIRFHFGDSLWLNAVVSPEYIPILGVFRGVLTYVVLGQHAPATVVVDFFCAFEREAEVEKLFCNESYHEILRRTNIEHQFIVIIKLRVVKIILHPYSFRKNFLFFINQLFLNFFLLLLSFISGHIDGFGVLGHGVRVMNLVQLEIFIFIAVANGQMVVFTFTCH